jgi:hypothetical protein
MKVDIPDWLANEIKAYGAKHQNMSVQDFVIVAIKSKLERENG